MTFSEIKKQIESLKQKAIKELLAQKAELEGELQRINADLAGLESGSFAATPAKRRGRPPGKERGPKPGKKKATGTIENASHLKDILSRAEGRTLNRKGFGDLGYRLKSALLIAKEYPDMFTFKQNRAQGSVSLK